MVGRGSLTVSAEISEKDTMLGQIDNEGAIEHYFQTGRVAL